MHPSPFRRLLAWAVTASLLLPIALTLVLGLASLLAALGDAAAATACGRLALALGVAWLTAVVATALTSGLVALGNEPRDDWRLRRQRQRQRRRHGRRRRHARHGMQGHGEGDKPDAHSPD
jgi:membrane protein implicated in regulation of membrane protease activity